MKLRGYTIIKCDKKTHDGMAMANGQEPSVHHHFANHDNKVIYVSEPVYLKLASKKRNRAKRGKRLC